MSPEHVKEMDTLRTSIQLVDADILRLLEERIGYVLRVGEIKGIMMHLFMYQK